MIYLTKDNPMPRIDFGSLPPEVEGTEPAKIRARAEEEARRDLAKSYEQLFADAYEETINNNDIASRAMLAGRRIAGITVRSAMAMDGAARESARASNENIKLQAEIKTLSKRVFWLSIVIAAITVISTTAACLQAYYAYRADLRATSAQATK